MANEFSTIECCEVDGTRDESLDIMSGDTPCSVTLSVEHAKRYDLVTDLIGNARVWPFATGNAPARCRRCGIKSQSGQAMAESGSQVLTWERSLVTAYYSVNLNSATDAGSSSSAGPYDLFSEEIEPTVEFLQLPYDKYRWGGPRGAAITEKEAPGQLFCSLKIKRTIFNVAPPLPTWLLGLIGCVNADEYESSVLGLVFAPETLLFLPSTMSRTVNSNWNSAFNVGVSFAYKPQGWNVYYRGATQSYQEMWLAKPGQLVKSYTPADMSEFLI